MELWRSSKPDLSKFDVQDVKHVKITERPSVGQAALEPRATPQLDFLRTGLSEAMFLQTLS
jgi:hypothetical protein